MESGEGFVGDGGVRGGDERGEKLGGAGGLEGAAIGFGVGGEGAEAADAGEVGVRGGGGGGDELEDLGLGDGGLGSWEALDSMRGVESAPGLDQAAEGVVGSEGVGVGGDGELGDRAGGVVVGEEPGFDGVAVVGDAGGEGDGILHDLEGDGAEEVVGDFDFVHFWFVDLRRSIVEIVDLCVVCC